MTTIENVKLVRDGLTEEAAIYTVPKEYNENGFRFDDVCIDGNIVPRDKYVSVRDSRTISFNMKVPSESIVTATIYDLR